ncbi:MAG: DcrB-related protein [Aggregatilineales bacterium]
MWLSPPITQDNRQHANLGLMIAQIVEDITPEQYMQRTLESQVNTYKDFQILSENQISANTGESGIYVQMSWYNEREDLFVTQSHFYFAKENKVYLFVGSRPTELPEEQAGEIDGLFQSMIDSLNFEEIPLFS